MHIEIRTAEPFVPEPCLFEIHTAIEKLESHKSPGTDQILAELIQAGSKMLCSHAETRNVWSYTFTPPYTL